MAFLTEPLRASSSSSSSSSSHDLDHHPNHRYDVFLSFRGVDTRNGFTDHLYNALLDTGVVTFLDDEEIETGEPLKSELDSAIRSSTAFIIILSKNYASSPWCLDELVLILDQKRKFKKNVIPIFYHVKPTDVKNQQSSFSEAMANHKQKMEAETDVEKKNQLAQKMELWKKALVDVANLKGKDVKDRKETEFINEVVKDIHRRYCLPLNNILPLLIGMEYETELISSWLTDGSCHRADILTIVGMSGFGKTSLARYVFRLHSSKFDKSSFIECIDTKCASQVSGLLDLQKQLCGDISKNIPLHVHDVSVYTSTIKNALSHKKILLVLDDVGCLDQLDTLLGNEAFHQGSKIIITTKVASLTERCALFNPQVEPKHTKVSLKGLYEPASLELLCIHAFKSNKPKEGYKEVSEELVKYCQGHPLALQVLGRSLQKRDVTYWQECIKSLKKEPESRINMALKTSFDALPFRNDKELFKHIACFFVGKDKHVIERILNACDINTRSGIINLVDRCLLSISSRNNLMMHQLVQEMGKNLVRQESPEKPWKRSRLWCHEESFKVLKQNKGKGNLLGLTLDMRMLDKKKLLELGTESLSKMDNVMLLQLNYVKLKECFHDFPEELRWLSMHGFPLKSIYLDFPMKNLVALDLSYSNIEYFDMFEKRQKQLVGSSSKDKQWLGSLKILDLSFCQQLYSVGGFFLLHALERLILRNCIRLIKVCESIKQCDELVHIDLSYCYKLKKLPISLGKLKKVKEILLDGCNFREPQIEMGNVKAIPSDLKHIVFSLPSTLRILSLANSNLSNECFPMDLSCLALLEKLSLKNNPIISMPICVRTLPRLQELNMNYCQTLISIENPPCTLRELLVYSKVGYRPSIRKIKFYREMSPLHFFGVDPLLSSTEIDGMMKIQDMKSVKGKVLNSLGWRDLDFIKERHYRSKGSWEINFIQCETQMYYEFGIFSTFYEGKEMPNWISFRSKGPSLSFTIPSSPKKLQGLNLCCVEMRPFNELWLPVIKISNITKNHTWIYKHYIEGVKLSGNKHYYEDGGECSKDGVREEYFLSWLSHWMFSPNEMKAGDHITISVGRQSGLFSEQVTKKCGIGLVFDDDGKIGEEENVLDYYKSWNHIVGGDLSAFQLTTGEYILHNYQFMRYSPKTYSHYSPFFDYVSKFKEKEMGLFRAFSQKKKSEISDDEVDLNSHILL